MNSFEKVLLSFIAVIIIYTFTIFGFIAYSDAKCLEMGYPKTQTTWNFKAYCINLTGSVTTRVTPQQ